MRYRLTLDDRTQWDDFKGGFIIDGVPQVRLSHNRWNGASPGRFSPPDLVEAANGHQRIEVAVGTDRACLVLGTVVVTGPPVPIVAYGKHNEVGKYVVVGVEPGSSHAYLMNNGDGFPIGLEPIALGPNPEQHIGRYWLPSAHLEAMT